jgi:hypothetical protein
MCRPWPSRTCCSHAATCSCPPAEQLNLDSWRSQLQLYNTLTRQKETFQPRPDNGDNVQMYVCGVTVYDYSHIGHARVYVAFDVLYRLLRYLRYSVQYVRNFTDIDDKIIKRANEAGEDPLALSARFIEEFHKVGGWVGRAQVQAQLLDVGGWVQGRAGPWPGAGAGAGAGSSAGAGALSL